MFRYDRLDVLVKETGKKKNYLSQKMGFSGRYLNDAKKQNTDIKGDPLKILADELNTTPDYLSGLSDEKEKPKENKKSPAPEGAELDPITKELFEIVNTSDEDELRALLEMARLIKKRRES